MIQLNYRDSKSICEQIKDGFRKLIRSDSIGAHEKLPSVRELSSGLAINPNTIRRAYRELETEGYIYTVAGKGEFASELKGADGSVPNGSVPNGTRQKELLEEFDEIVEELLYLSVNKSALLRRMENLTEGEERA